MILWYNSESPLLIFTIKHKCRVFMIFLLSYDMSGQVMHLIVEKLTVLHIALKTIEIECDKYLKMDNFYCVLLHLKIRTQINTVNLISL